MESDGARDWQGRDLNNYINDEGDEGDGVTNSLIFKEQERQRGFVEKFREKGQRELTWNEFLEREAGEWIDRCWICDVLGQDSDHGLFTCPNPESLRAKAWFKRIRAAIKYPRYTFMTGHCSSYIHPRKKRSVWGTQPLG